MGDRGRQLLFSATCSSIHSDTVSDAELVRRVARDCDRAAFELLLWRHGPAVWTACRRILGSSPDAEDVFQFVFLTLSRRAGAIANGAAVAGWLYRVAVRTALEAGRLRTRRAGVESPMANLPEAAAGDDPVGLAIGREVGTVLDVEISRLPERYRLPFLLCEIYGQDCIAVAAELGCAAGTVASRVSRAKKRLRARLRGRGLVLSASLCTVAVPPAMRAAALQVAFAPIAKAQPHLLTVAMKSVSGGIGWLKTMAAAVCLATVTGAVGLFAQASKSPPQDRPAGLPKVASADVAATSSVPLPAGAVAKLGSAGLRHPDMIFSVAYSADGKWIATAGRDGTARVWDARTGDLKYRFPIPDNRDQPRVTFMDGGEVLWVLPSRYPKSRQIQRYSMADGKELPNFLSAIQGKSGTGMGAGFDPAGRVFAYTEYDSEQHSEVTLIDSSTGKLVAKLAGRGPWSMEPVLAAGGQVVACPGNPVSKTDGAVRLVRAKSGVEIATIETGGAVQATVFSPNGRLVATSSILPRGEMKAASIWDAATGKLVRHLEGASSARSLAFSPDGKLLAVSVSGGNGPVLLFDVSTGKEVLRVSSRPTVTEIAFSPDCARLVASRSIGTVSVWNVATGRPTPPSAEPDLLSPVRFVDADHLLVALPEGAVVYDWRTGRVLERSALPPSAVPLDRPQYTASPDRKLLAESQFGPVIRLCDFKTGAEVRRLEGHADAVAMVRFSDDGAKVYSLGYDRTIRIWETTTGRQLRRVDLGESKVGGTFKISRDERWLAVDLVTPGQPVLRVWDLQTWSEVAPPKLPTEFVHSSVFSPDGTILLIAGGARSRFVTSSGSKSGWLVQWDLTTRSVRGTWTVPGGALTSSFSSDGRTVITGGFDGTIRVWELATGTERRALRGHDFRVFQVIASPDGRHLASGGADGLTYIWDPYARSDDRPTDSNQAWADLGAPEGGKSFVALCRMVEQPADAFATIRDRLKLAKANDPKRIQDLIHALNSDRFAVREQATADLRRLGREIETIIRLKLEANPSAEARERLTGLLEKMPAPTPDELRELRSVEVLERIGTSAAVGLLKKWAGDTSLLVAPGTRAAVNRIGKP